MTREKRIRWIRRELKSFVRIHEERLVTQRDLHGVRLGISDLIAEEMLEILEGEMDDKQIYEAAAERARNRNTSWENLADDGSTGISSGIAEVFHGSKYPLNPNPRAVETEDTYSFAFIAGVLLKLDAVKGKSYGSSFQKRGELMGVKANVDRKFDRLESVLSGNGEAGESVTETLGDLGVYVIKWLTRRAETHPEEFRAWLEEVRSLG